MDNSVNILAYVLIFASLLILAGAVSFRRKVKKEIRNKNEELKRKDAEFNELRLLAAGATHEINNAITIILGRASQLIKLHTEDPFQEKYLKNIQSTTQRIDTSVKGLRQFIYPDSKEIEEFIELPLLMDDVLKLVGQRLRNHGIELKLKGIEHKFFKGRKTQLEQLIINLLNQSIERLEEVSVKWVQLTAVEEGEHLNLYYMDSSGEVGDKVGFSQCESILENNHGHLTVNQNNLIIELSKPNMNRYQY